MSAGGLGFWGVDYNGQERALPSPASWTLTRSFDSPADSFEGSFPWEQWYPELYTLRVRRGEALLFEGGIDETACTLDGRGRWMRVLARSAGAALLDNEALPQLELDRTLNQMFQEHIAPCGVTQLVTDVGEDAFLNQYQIGKGTSEWEAFTNFVRLTGLAIPHLDGQGRMVCLNQLPQGTLHTFSNQGTGQRYSGLKVVNNRYSPVSQFVIRDQQGYYSYTFNHPHNAQLKLQRRRYLIPSPSFSGSATGGRIDADLLVRRSMLGKQVITLTLPGHLEVAVGDRANLATPTQDYLDRFIYQVRLQLSEEGATTALTLLDRDFI